MNLGGRAELEITILNRLRLIIFSPGAHIGYLIFR